MSTLQISLAVAGGLVLAAVVAHSAWSSRRNLPKQATPEAPPPEQAAAPAPDNAEGAAADERQEPSFDVDSGLSAPHVARRHDARQSPALTADRRDGADRDGGHGVGRSRAGRHAAPPAAPAANPLAWKG